MRCSELRHTSSTKCVAVIQESTFDVPIMNMMIDSSCSVCSRPERVRIARVTCHSVIPGTAIMLIVMSVIAKSAEHW